MFDPHPGKALLTAGEVATLLSMEARSFSRFYRETPDFPLPIDTGKRARPKWRKDEVLAWIMTRPRVPRPEAGAQERPKPAK